jgi:hypothetical protein
VAKGPIEFSVFTPALADETFPEVRHAPSLLDCVEIPRRNAWGSLLCAAAILAVHLAIMDPFIGAPAARAQKFTVGDSGPASDEDASLQVVLINTPKEAAGHLSPLPAPVIRQMDVDKLLRKLSETKDVLLEEPTTVDKAKALTDVAGDSVMAGRYLGQINARIERAWQRPRTEIGSEVFACTVEVEQDSRGNVKKTTLMTCNGNERWQQSLVTAILAASPLPAPPDPAVFRRNMRLVFQSGAYQEGRSGDGFEPAKGGDVGIVESQRAAPVIGRQ